MDQVVLVVDGGSITPPSTQTSQKPKVFTLTAGDNYVSGSGVANSTINVTLPNSTVLTTTVDSAKYKHKYSCICIKWSCNTNNNI